ncbi:MAG: cytochrome C552 [Proteobacteria bacterium]|nr:cytochrome C552 [Pseudomonadota bacterium]NOG61551.1 cytochrome C552 [Pseudomonadota bacterium]
MTGPYQNLFSNILKRKIILGTTLGVALFFMLIGVLFWGGFNMGMEATNTMEFCISCHEMEENVYQEYKGTIHDANRSGVRAGCPDCHVPRPWIYKMKRKLQASNEVLHKILGTIDTPEKFEAHRLQLAKNEWARMKASDSRECRNCHEISTMDPEAQKPRARKQHYNAMKTGQTCIDCHKGIAHKKVHDQLTEEEKDELEKPNPDFIRPIPEAYDKFINGDKKTKKTAKAEPEKEDVVKQETKVADATTKAVPASSSDSSGVDWEKAPERLINIFYPGQASMEWILGKNHSGKRAFKSGDRCFECHDEETVDIGELVASGEHEYLAETETLIPEKRGSIPVSVRATHDGENLYVRFQFPETGHTPAPFADGGKMDAENQIKLAIMLATDDVTYADRAGCWGTCHIDAKGMPEAPSAEETAASGLALNFEKGVTKYLTESRTKIEIKGRGGKKRGGWDKLKEEADIKTELEAGHFMDLIRYQAGTGKSEDGYILEQRHMEGGQGSEFTSSLADGTWTILMKRKLASEKAGDISLATDQVYNLGFAIHDDYTNGRYHHVSLGYKLGFDNDEAEINAVKQ